jgi:hypothetical protein
VGLLGSNTTRDSELEINYMEVFPGKSKRKGENNVADLLCHSLARLSSSDGSRARSGNVLYA